MKTFIKKIKYVVESNEHHELNPKKVIFLKFDNAYLPSDNDTYHLPFPVYSYINTTNPSQFLLPIILSWCRFETEV